jgi:hypothetical protein
VTVGVDLLRGAVEVGTPPGVLIAVPYDSQAEHPGLTGLGSRVDLVYVPVEELAT